MLYQEGKAAGAVLPARFAPGEIAVALLMDVVRLFGPRKLNLVKMRITSQQGCFKESHLAPKISLSNCETSNLAPNLALFGHTSMH